MGALRIALVILAGLLSAPLTDGVSVLWMSLAPGDLDLTGSYFLSVLLPSVMLVHLLMAFVFWKVFEPEPTRNPMLFVITHGSAQAAMLSLFENPMADILVVVTIVVVSGTAVMMLFRYYFWCEHCSAMR